MSEEEIEEKLWFLLYHIAHFKAIEKKPISAPYIYKNLNISQQTTARRLAELESGGLIVKKENNSLSLTPRGYLQLQIVCEKLSFLLSDIAMTEVFSGLLASGFGEGAYYIKKEGYLTQFTEKLKFKPYFGTLNLKLKPELFESFIKGQQINQVKSTLINGFEDGDREYGAVKCYFVELWTTEDNRIKGALLQIQRTAHKENVLEFIAPLHLRSHFKLNTGERIHFKFLKL